MSAADADHQQLFARALARWKADPVAFVTTALINPETSAPFVLYPAQVRFLREGFTPRADGHRRHHQAHDECRPPRR